MRTELQKYIHSVCECVCVCVYWPKITGYGNTVDVWRARSNVKLAVIKVKYLANKSWFAIRCVLRVCQFWIFIGFIRCFQLRCVYLFDKLMRTLRRKCESKCRNRSIFHLHHVHIEQCSHRKEHFWCMSCDGSQSIWQFLYRFNLIPKRIITLLHLRTKFVFFG